MSSVQICHEMANVGGVLLVPVMVKEVACEFLNGVTVEMAFW